MLAALAEALLADARISDALASTDDIEADDAAASIEVEAMVEVILVAKIFCVV